VYEVCCLEHMFRICYIFQMDHYIIMFAVLLRRVILAVVGVGVVVVVGPLRGVIELARFGAGM